MDLKNRIKRIIILIFLFLVLLSTNIYATEIEKGEYSKKYEEWLELDENERKNTIPPLPINIREEKNKGINNFFEILKTNTIPTTYDLREHINIEVKNQMNTGLCWGFSANTTVETYLALNNKTYDFSERHIEYNTAKNSTYKKNPDALNRNLGSGGYQSTAFTYYSRGSGPVLEKDMPFKNNEEIIEIQDLPTNVAVQKVDNMIYFPNIYKTISDGEIIYEDANRNPYTHNEITEIRNQIKEHIMTYGGITASVNAEEYHLNKNTYADNLNHEDVLPNHAVTIIGWDDNYSAENFHSKYKPTKDGAYIVLNSWGETWGNNGIYYISYEDFLVETQLRGVTSVSDINYDNIYQHDTSEMNGWIISRYAANVYTAKENEILTEVVIGTLAKQTCNVYINQIGNDLNINNLTKIASNVVLQPGYNTIKVNNNINITKGNNFSIVVELIGSYYGIGIEDDNEIFPNVLSNAQESYASNDGINWTDLYKENDMKNFSIKVYTQQAEKTINIGELRGTVKQGIGGKIGFPISTTYEAKGEIAKITILKDNLDVTKDFIISGNTIRGNGAYITLIYPSNIKNGEYSIQVTLQNVGTVTKNEIFTGEKENIAECIITGIEDKIYTGNSIKQNILVKNTKRTLVEGTDYEIRYINNVYPGKVCIEVIGKGIFEGKITRYFYIYPRQVTGLTLSTRGYNDLQIRWNQEVNVTGYEVYLYNLLQNEYVRLGTTAGNSCMIYNLLEGTQYSIKVRAYKTIDGKNYCGEYSGVLTETTNIRSDISKYSISGIKNRTYTGNNITQSITIKNGNKTLNNGVDYSVSYLNNKNIGISTVIITGKGNYKGTITKTFIITPKKVTELKAKNQEKDRITLSWSKQTGAKAYKLYTYNYKKEKWEYVGKTTKNTYTIKKLKTATTYKYRVRAYMEVGNTQYYGSYSSSIKTSTKTKTPSISKLTTKSKKAIIKWNKVSGASGYEIYMSTSKSGKYSKIKTITKGKTISYTKTNLKKNKKYYFKIRTYRNVDGKKIYSSYSSIKSIKIK